MHILHTITSIDPKTGGTAQAVNRLSSMMRSLGHEVTILTIDAPEMEPPEIANGVSISMKGPGEFGSFHYSKDFSQWLEQNVESFDAVIVHGLWQYTGFASARACRKAGIPYFVYTHGMLDPWFNRTYPLKKLKKYMYWRWGEFRVLRDARSVLFTCEEEKILAAQSFKPYQVNAAVVGLGADTLDKSATELKSTFDSNRPAWAQRPYFLFMSRIQEKKGLDLLIAAYSKARQAKPNLPDLVVAGPVQQVEYAASLKRNYPQEGIHWVGNLSGELKWQALASAEAMTLISHQENFGIVVAESLSVGVPVIISDKVNIYREIQSAGAGIICDDTEGSALEAIERWASMDERARESMKASTTTCFQTYFDIQTATQQLLDEVSKHIVR